MNKLYAYITSRDYIQRFTEIGETANGLSELDAQERKQHDKTWSNRASMVARLRNLTRDIDAEVSGIIEGGQQSEALPVSRAAKVGT